MARLWWGDSSSASRRVGRIPGFALDARPIVAIMAFATGVEAMRGRVPEERGGRGGRGAAPLRGTLAASWSDQGERAGRPESSHFVAPPVTGALRGGGSGSLFGLLGRHKNPRQDNKKQPTRREAVSSAVASALGKGSATALGVLKLASVPYLVVLALLFTFQRTILFPRPADVADPTLSGGRLIILPASKELMRYATPRKNSSTAPPAAAEGDGVEAEAPGEPRVAAVFFQPPSPEAPTLVYVHGNADQIGWGGAYLGRVMREQHGLGFYGIEFPGYGVSTGLKTEEASMYLAAEQLINHLTAPHDQGGLGVDPGSIVLVGQSIGSAVASEMCLRGKGRSLVLLAPFLSMRKIATSLFPFITPGLLAAPWLLKDRFDNEVRMSKLGVPILVLHGDCDDIVPYWQGKAVSELNPKARLVTVPDAAHNDLFASSHEPTVVGEIVRFVHGDYGGGS